MRIVTHLKACNNINKSVCPPPKGEGIRYCHYQGCGRVGSAEAVAENLKTIRYAAEAAANNFKVHIITFSELFLQGYTLTMQDVQNLAEEVGGPSLAKVASFAKEFRVAIVIPFAEKATEDGVVKYYDSMALFSNEGVLMRTYRKHVLWGPEEKAKFSPGVEPFETSEVNGVAIGLANCYEAEFPELARAYALQGAKLIMYPTAADVWEWVEFPKKDENGRFVPGTGEKTPKPYPDVSKTCIPARAVDNIAFVAYCNSYGVETDMRGNPMMEFLGNSVVADPHGQVVVRAPHHMETLIVVDCIPSEFKSFHPRKSHYLENLPHAVREELHAVDKRLRTE